MYTYYTIKHMKMNIPFITTGHISQRLSSNSVNCTINQKSSVIVLVHYIRYKHNIHAEKYVTKHSAVKNHRKTSEFRPRR